MTPDSPTTHAAVTAFAGEPSVNDARSVTLYKRDGALWLATGWDGLRAAEQKVQQGNIQVHKKKT